MKRLLAGTALFGGILLLLVPRYILPACEYLGFARMHCSDTAEAEYIAGALLMLIGAGSFWLSQWWQLIAASVLACVLFGISFWLPDVFGYCLSPRMPCHYGMVPGVRLIAVAGFVLTIIALASFVKASRRKGHS
ncbi:MAG TPA: DUF4418 family protein [Nitrospirota bacterium]|nr:DUF4418 family protein [Nitrospirota bacterium]